MAVICATDLSVKRQGRQVLSNVSFSAHAGEITGILGPRGSGKSSLMHLLAGLLAPSSGSALVNDFDILESPGRVRQSVGVLFQEVFIDDFLTARGVLELHARMHGLAGQVMRHRVESLLSQLGLAEKSSVPVRYFTLFKKRKLALARAVVHSPVVLLLDEPTAGLPADQCADMWSTMIKLNAQYKIAVIVATHSWEECERLCDRVVLLHKGQCIAQGTLEDLKAEVGGSTAVLQLDRAVPRLVEALKSLWFVKDVKASDRVVEITVRPAELDVEKITRLVNRFPCRLMGLSMHKPNLNDVFYRHAGSFIEEAGGKP